MSRTWPGVCRNLRMRSNITGPPSLVSCWTVSSSTDASCSERLCTRPIYTTTQPRRNMPLGQLLPQTRIILHQLERSGMKTRRHTHNRAILFQAREETDTHNLTWSLLNEPKFCE